MRDLTFTVYASARDNHGTPQTLPWSDWSARLSKHDARGNPSDSGSKTLLEASKDGPALVLGHIPGVDADASSSKG